MSKKAHETALPKLRFPEFRDKEAWKEKQIKELFKLEDKPEKGGLFDNEKIITVRLHGLGVVKNDRAAALTGGTSYFKREAGQFIFSKIDLLNGAFGLVPEKLDGFVSSTDIPALTFKNQKSAGFFLNWLLANYKTLAVERTGTSTTLKRVSKNGFLDSAIWLPSVEEQQKVAAALSSLDALLTAQTAKLTALQAHKRGLMQDLFPTEGETVPKRRFPEFQEAGEWATESAGKLCDFIVPGRNKPKKFQGNIPWITMPDLVHNEIIYKSKSGLALSLNEAQSIGTRIAPKNSVIISCVGNLGLVSIAGNDLVVNQQLHVFIAKSKLYSRFLLYSLSTKKAYMEKIATKTAVLYLNKENCNSIPVSFPSLAEQQKIADCLSSLDNLITAQTQKIDALKLHKKGLMQALFPTASEQDA